MASATRSTGPVMALAHVFNLEDQLVGQPSLTGNLVDQDSGGLVWGFMVSRILG
jgi:hypothetical protein